MGQVLQSTSDTFSLPAYETLVVAVSTPGSGSLSRLADSAGGPPQSYAELSDGQSRTLGPFSHSTFYKINCFVGSITYTQGEAVDFPTVDEVQDLITGGTGLITVETGEDIEALTAVYILNGIAFKSDKTDLYKTAGCIGVTTTSALNGNDINIQTSGQISDVGWNWANSTNPSVWLGIDGALTQSAPTTGYLRRIGTATSATAMIIQPGEVVALS